MLPVSVQAFLQKHISLQSLELITLDLPQKIVFRSGIGVRKSRQALIVKWTDIEGNVGYGECSCRPDPFYSAEFLNASLMLVEQFILPAIQQQTTYGEVMQAMKKVRGWRFTKAAIEYAMHDLIRRRDGESIFDHWERPSIEKIPVGISLGIQDSYENLERVIKESQDAGYRRLKFKIHPEANHQYFIRLRQELRDTKISFDANGTFQAHQLEALRTYADFNTMIEQPFPLYRMDIYEKAKKMMPSLFVCLDEEVKGLGTLQMAHHLGTLDELNLKPGRVGGICNSIMLMEYCFEHDIPCWIGGMFETGIGRSLNMKIASFLPHASAHDQSPSSRYFQEDVVRNVIDMDEDGYVDVAVYEETEVNEAILEKYCVTRKLLNSPT